MTDPYLHKNFIFNEKIDREFLFSLYEDDLLYIEEIFKTTLDQLSTVVPDIQATYNDNDVSQLKKLVHKIKPAFGFTGFLDTEKACKVFEDACHEGVNAVELSGLYHPLWKLLVDSMDGMQKQYEKLKEFNSP
jgi:HPt (histidine-containing phosphotransfer) domain-containing protein